MSVKKRGLGRGLDALLTSNRTSNSDTATVISSELQQLPVEFLSPGKYQPRKDMSQEALEDLASSIRAQGVIQPIVVRPLAKNKFEIPKAPKHVSIFYFFNIFEHQMCNKMYQIVNSLFQFAPA